MKPDAVALLDKSALRAALLMFKLPTSGEEACNEDRKHNTCRCKQI